MKKDNANSLDKNNKTIENFENIKKKLFIKTIEGNNYYYYKSPFIRINKNGKKAIKLYSLGNIETSDEELFIKYKKVVKKDIYNIQEHIFKLFKSIYKTKYLNDVENKKLAILKFTYLGLLSRYNDSDLEKYKEKCYTEYVYGTTSIEGNTYTLRETDITLNEGQTVSGKEKREFYEIENYSKLQEYYTKINNSNNNHKIKINESLIKKIHKIIMSNIDDNDGGNYRNIYVGIRGTRFEPTPPIMIEEEIKELINWYNKNKDLMNPIELASIFHQRFEEIHPFTDGNGRTGREVLRLILQNNNLPTIFIDRTNREEYLKCLDLGNNENYAPLCKFIAKNLIETHSKLLEIAKKEIKLKK